MSKRESDLKLEEFLVGYFKKRKYHKPCELFETFKLKEISIKNNILLGALELWKNFANISNEILEN